MLLGRDVPFLRGDALVQVESSPPGGFFCTSDYMRRIRSETCVGAGIEPIEAMESSVTNSAEAQHQGPVVQSLVTVKTAQQVSVFRAARQCERRSVRSRVDIADEDFAKTCTRVYLRQGGGAAR